MTSDCLEDSTSPRTGREKKVVLPDLVTVGEAAAHLEASYRAGNQEPIHGAATAADGATAGLLWAPHTASTTPCNI